uniref:peptidylprolyl isomerase n=4 Tax=Lygus hesperus TaxID=30085 RepID=A0A0K8SNY2_LYGHE
MVEESNVSAGEDITPKQDGGVLKKITNEGTGTAKPASGCKVTVHYTGTLLDGTEFDSSRTRDSPFKFQLGKGKVIQGWDIGVATMKLGERAVFTIREDYGYGEAGSPPKIPPKATLVFDVELISWDPENLSGKKDRGILRYPITAGNGFESPKEMAEVKVLLKGTVEGRVFDEREVTFNLGEGKVHDIPPGIDKALENFVLNETSDLELTPEYGYGAEGNAKFNVPPNATLKYTVTLKSFEKIKDRWMLSNEEKVEESKRLKEKGTNYFKAGQYDLALKLYNKVTEYLNGSAGFENELEEERKALELAGHLNAAMCHLKLNNHLDAKNACDSALGIDPDNQKALFRRGQAYLSLSEPELAKADFEKVAALDSTNKAASAQILICNQKLKEIRSKEKQMYANMFEKFAQKDREWRFGWLEGEKPQVEVVPDDPEIAEMRKKRREQKIKYLEQTARLLKEKREREEKERQEREKEEQEKLARGEPLEGKDQGGSGEVMGQDGGTNDLASETKTNSASNDTGEPKSPISEQPSSLPVVDQPQPSEVSHNT